jgi:hypothetical protein
MFLSLLLQVHTVTKCSVSVVTKVVCCANVVLIHNVVAEV